MCSAVPGSFGRPHFVRLFNTTSRKFAPSATKIDTDVSDVRNIALLWNRMPPREQSRYPQDQQPFTLSRQEKEENCASFFKNLCVVEDSMLTLKKSNWIPVPPVANVVDYFRWLPTKICLLGMEDKLPSVTDIVTGNKQVFRMVLDCYRKGNFDRLKPMTLGGWGEALDFHRKAASKLTEKQRSSLVVTDDDFVGSGFVSHWNGMNTERGELARFIHKATSRGWDAAGGIIMNPYFFYSVYVIAVRQKSNLFKMVRSLPYNPSPERMLLRMPPSYGFIAPRYVIMRLDICHKMWKGDNRKLRLTEDCLIYDFHVHSFS